MFRSSFETHDRIDRAKLERMYLIERPLPTQFVIRSQTDKLYTIKLSHTPGKSTCTCMDYKLRQKHCKHINFILIRVLNFNERSDVVLRERLTEFDLFQIVDRNTRRVEELGRELEQDRINQNNNDQKLDQNVKINQRPICDSDTCIICYEDLKGELLSFCSTCGQNVHKTCVDIYFSHNRQIQNNRICIFCRGKW